MYSTTTLIQALFVQTKSGLITEMVFQFRTELIYL